MVALLVGLGGTWPKYFFDTVRLKEALFIA